MDDIVTRLRHIADELLHNDYCADLFEAADEIERLRNFGDMLEMAVRQGIGVDDALDKWSEARG